MNEPVAESNSERRLREYVTNLVGSDEVDVTAIMATAWRRDIFSVELNKSLGSLKNGSSTLEDLRERYLDLLIGTEKFETFVKSEASKQRR